MPQTPQLNDIVFAERPERVLKLDIRMPTNGAERPPVVMYIPMGGMRGCPKENGQYWLTEHGFAMASIEARVSSEAIAPAAVYDCKAAIRWLRAHADEYGYRADAIGAWGHSAGGLLAALMATSGDAPELKEPGRTNPAVSDKVQAACDFCGSPHDLAYFGLPAVKSRFPGVTENIRLYLGGLAEDRAELAHFVSPRTYVSSKCPPMLIIHGDEDSSVPLEESIDFHEALRAVGVDSTLRVLPGIGHGWDASLTRDDVVGFFTRTLMS